MKIRESRRIRKWKEGFGEETETSRGGFLIDSPSPFLGGAVSSPRAPGYAKALKDDPYTLSGVR